MVTAPSSFYMVQLRSKPTLLLNWFSRYTVENLRVDGFKFLLPFAPFVPILTAPKLWATLQSLQRFCFRHGVMMGCRRARGQQLFTDLYKWTWGSLPGRRQQSTSCSGRGGPAEEWRKAEEDEVKDNRETYLKTAWFTAAVMLQLCISFMWRIRLAGSLQTKKKESC